MANPPTKRPRVGNRNEVHRQSEKGCAHCAEGNIAAFLQENNRPYHRAVVGTLRFLASRGLPVYEGVYFDEDNGNEGNWAELLDLTGELSKSVKNIMLSLDREYPDEETLDELVELMANMVRDKITEELKKTKYFSLICTDTTLDYKQNVSIAVRYVNEHNQVCEEFLSFMDASVDVETQFKSLKNILAKYKIDINKCVGQSYNGAASLMTHCERGSLWQRLWQEVPAALYIHCHAQTLDLIFADVASEGSVVVADFFNAVNVLGTFLSRAVVQDVYLDKQADTGQRVRCRLFGARNEDKRQHGVLHGIQMSLPAIVATLKEIISQVSVYSAQCRTEARVAEELIHGRFVLALTFFEHLFRITKPEPFYDQPDLSMLTGLRETIAQLAAEDVGGSWQGIQTKALALCSDVGVSLKTSDIDDLRTQCFYPVIDRCVSELTKRFSPEAVGVLTGIQALNPAHSSFLEYTSLQPMARFYGLSVTEDDLRAQLHVTRRFQEAKPRLLHNAFELLESLECHKEALPDVCELLCIGQTLPLTRVSKSCFNHKPIRTGCEFPSIDRDTDLSVLALNSEKTKRLTIKSIVSAYHKAQTDSDYK